ncbi:hypothetical protein L2744_04930 [Shewanella profunda]|nr:hypothetical protein [Shewanella profunda]
MMPVGGVHSGVGIAFLDSLNHGVANTPTPADDKYLHNKLSMVNVPL